MEDAMDHPDQLAHLEARLRFHKAEAKRLAAAPAELEWQAAQAPLREQELAALGRLK
jgi:hypothetical protein